MKEKMLGKIKWYKANKGYGYIIGGDSELYYFELLSCLNPDEVFESGDMVKFVPHFMGTEYATEVEKVVVNDESRS